MVDIPESVCSGREIGLGAPISSFSVSQEIRQRATSYLTALL